MTEITLDEATTEVHRLVRQRLYSDPRVVFSDAVRVRDQVHHLVEQRSYPFQASQLYFLTSVTCSLLANLSDAFGFSRVAVEHSRTGWAYAEIINHDTLRLLARKMQAAIAFRDNRPNRALELALSATPWISEPMGRTIHHTAIAKYQASIGQRDQARKSLNAALDAFDATSEGSEIFDGWGGLFSRPRAKILYEMTDPYLLLGDIQGALQVVTEAAQLNATMPVELRAIDRGAATAIALAHTQLLAGNADGAAETLAPVLDLPAVHRLKWVVARMKEFRAALLGHGAVASPLGRQLGERVEEFIEVTAASVAPNALN